MVRAADILNELRLCVDWARVGLVPAIGLTAWFIGLPDDPGLALTTALVGVAVWGCP